MDQNASAVSTENTQGVKRGEPESRVCYHVQANTGYAINPLEIMFHRVRSDIAGSPERVHMGYRDYNQGKPRWLGQAASNLLTISYRDMTATQLQELANYIGRHKLRNAPAFDLLVGTPIIAAFRKGGIKDIISYYGAPMSPFNHGITLLLKRLRVLLTTNKPDHVIFESYGMKKTAIHGRGVMRKRTSVVRLGIDVDEFSGHTNKCYVYETMGIPVGRKIVFYPGHMKKKKGVDVIARAATELVTRRRRDDIYFLIWGNREGEERMFDGIYKGTSAEDHITFGGYRYDIPELMPDCYAAVIASTGWDSFPRSSLEMAAAGLPLLVSTLPGLNETVDNGTTGLLFKPGGAIDLSCKLERLLDEPWYTEQLSSASVERVRKEFTLDIQEYNFKKTFCL